MMGVPFSVHVSSFEEGLHTGDYSSPQDYVEAMARGKALAVMRANGGDLVIGCDSVVVSDSMILEKPSTPEHAIQMLQSLSGHSHFVYSGVALIVKKQTTSSCETSEDGFLVETFSVGTEVEFDEISREAIENYVATGAPMDKAGAYGIQDGLATSFVKGIRGCYFNVTGFPIHAISKRMVALIDAHWGSGVPEI